MRPDDWNLLVIAAAEGGDLSPAQLRTALFLLGEKLNLPPGTRYDFVPSPAGPNCEKVESDAEALGRAQLVTVARSPTHRTYCATPSGLVRARELQDRLRERQHQYLDAVVGWVLRLSSQGLIEVILADYPEMKSTAPSVRSS